MISFETHNVEMPELDFSKTEIWLREVASVHDRKIGNLNYLFCDNEEILRVNRQFLAHDYFTDIITFDYSWKNRVSGDIFLSLETVKQNARDLNVDYQDELNRVIVHGLLHLCGINDKTATEREEMQSEEDRALDLLKNIK